MAALRQSSLLGPLVGVAAVAVLAILVASRTVPGQATASAEPSPAASALPSPSPPPTDAPRSTGQTPTMAPTADPPSPAATNQTAVEPPGRLPPFRWGPNPDGRCQALLKVFPDLDPYQLVNVVFTGGRYISEAEREAFAEAHGLEEIDVLLLFTEWPGSYTALYEYVIRDGTHPDTKVRELLALPEVERAYRPGLGIPGELADVVTVAVTAPPEYSEDGFLPELWIRFRQPMTDIDVEIFAVRYQLTKSGQRGDWYRFCEYGSVRPEDEREAVLSWSEVADVRFEVGRP